MGNMWPETALWNMSNRELWYHSTLVELNDAEHGCKNWGLRFCVLSFVDFAFDSGKLSLQALRISVEGWYPTSHSTPGDFFVLLSQMQI